MRAASAVEGALSVALVERVLRFAQDGGDVECNEVATNNKVHATSTFGEIERTSLALRRER